jgi:hypothetical protein
MADEKINRDQDKQDRSSGGRNPNRTSKPNTGSPGRTSGSPNPGSKSGGGSRSSPDRDSDRNPEKGE